MRSLRAGLVWAALIASASAAEWQWSVPMGEGRAFLWIPPDCARVRAVVVAQHNMIEQGLLEDAGMRRTLGALGLAEVWVTPPFDGPFDFNHGAGERFEQMMRDLADRSGYSELAFAPAVPIGHSACATFPWNFAAWNPGRTLAIISVHGDAPRTNLTGYGRPNIEWGDRKIDGVPGLMVMGEYEWLDSRLAPALAFRREHPRAPIALLAEPGRGHFDTSPELRAFLEMYIRKAVEQRLPADAPLDRAVPLRPVDPARGWLVERWYLDRPRTMAPAPASVYSEDRSNAFWAFDEEMARATQDYRAAQFGRKPQLLGYIQDGAEVPQTATHQQVNLQFRPIDDAGTFRIGTTFLTKVESGSPNLARWTGLPVGMPLGHAVGGGPIRLSVITGPVRQISADTFQVEFDRTRSTIDRRNSDIWLLAEQAGDREYKSAVQQALLKLPTNREGAPQQITFEPIADRPVGAKELRLLARSSSGLKVRFYIREGPAEIDGDRLRFTRIPPHAKLPVSVTVVAWQFGRGAEPKIQEAPLVKRSFNLTP